MLYENKNYTFGFDESVLILILMEYALWGKQVCRCLTSWWSLNPYSNGIYSMRRCNSLLFEKARSVLILILMEYTLWGRGYYHLYRGIQGVLILILMEYTLWEEYQNCVHILLSCLNPYSNGIYSMSDAKMSLSALENAS